MATNERQIEQLDAYLDGELPPDVADTLRRRIQSEPSLAAELDQLRAERSKRISAFGTMEADEGIADRLLAHAKSHVSGPTKHRWASPLRYAVATAASLAMGFVAGRLIEGTGPGFRVTPASHDSAYRVAITDDAGRVIAVQRFDSIEQATEFSEDLRRWQERQDQIRNGRVTIRSASF
jgi:anti-sigma factor RsiW